MAPKTLGRYGSRVLGEAQREEEKQIVKKAAHRYGPRVVDAEPAPAPAPAASTKPDTPPPPPADTAAETTSPPAEGDAPPPDAPDPDGQSGHPAAGADKYLSIREMEEALAANPALVDVFLGPEGGRGEDIGGPRKGAYRVMFEAEHRRSGGARPSVLDQIRTALDALVEAQG